MEIGAVGDHYETHSVLSSPASASTLLEDSAKDSVDHLRTGVGSFRSCLHKWLVTLSAAFECGPEKQTVDQVVLHCPIHRPPHGTDDLTVLNDETIEWLLNTSPEVEWGLAVD